MTATAPQRTSVIEWSVASQALPGQAVSGDLHVVAPCRDGVLVGVVDGLGHGDQATAAARVAVNVLEQHAGESLVALVQLCHRALQQTRGAVMTLVAIDPREETVSTIGVGNVEAMLRRANPRAKPQRESVLLRNGVVGYQLPALQTAVLPIAVGDTVVFATDGVREDFGDLINVTDPLPQLTQRIISTKFRGTDDGLVLAFKYVGAP
ncbi:MAG TPA: SpoIIE family protein phosphatase [Opitutaceae bacterium]|nr:SpoIIE family protein phosphatase [Opitutaceae bacterium]